MRIGARSVREGQRRGAGPAEGREGCANSRTACDPSHAPNQPLVEQKPQQENFQNSRNTKHSVASHFKQRLLKKKKNEGKGKRACVFVCVCDNPMHVAIESCQAAQLMMMRAGSQLTV